jgi:hypothetical protein
MCAEDPIFFANTFAWTYDPRPKAGGRKPSGVPFVLWDFQEQGLEEILRAMGIIGRTPHDLFIEKSRDMGVSWLLMLAAYWVWDNVPGQSGLLMSRKEDLVDKPGDPDSLMWKLDYVLDQMPDEMRPKYTRGRLHFENLHTGSVIDGVSTAADSARGGRRSWIICDEFAAVENGDEILAATADASPCRLWCTTPKGTGGAAYKLHLKPEVKKLVFGWYLHPEKARGMTVDAEGKKTSPWYVAECARRASRLEIAQEIDLDWHTSGGTFFDRREIDRHIQAYACEPLTVGTLEYDALACDPRAFVPEARGCLKLWFWPGETGRPPSDTDYVMGVDVSAGVGGTGSASIASVWSVQERRKVALYSTSHRRPDEFSRDCAALGRWFGSSQWKEAYILPEKNGGPGKQFTQTLTSTGYTRIYYQENDNSAEHRRGMNPGWFSTRERKETALGEYRRELAAMTVQNTSLRGLEECMSYVYLKNGGIGPPGGWWDKAPEEDQSRHGDEVMGDCLAVRALKEVKLQTAAEKADEHEGSYGWRRAQREAKLARKDLW